MVLLGFPKGMIVGGQGQYMRGSAARVEMGGRGGAGSGFGRMEVGWMEKEGKKRGWGEGRLMGWKGREEENVFDTLTILSVVYHRGELVSFFGTVHWLGSW